MRTIPVLLLALACSGCGGCVDDASQGSPGQAAPTPPGPPAQGLGPILCNRPHVQRIIPAQRAMLGEAAPDLAGD